VSDITPKEAVANGLAVLNNALGEDWVKQIDLDNLDMSAGEYLPAAFDAYGDGYCGCLLAQLAYDGNMLGGGFPRGCAIGIYCNGVERLSVMVPCTGEEWDETIFAQLHGFLAPDFDVFIEEQTYYTELQDEWTRVITAQLAELS
jgi:hypothetical protein